MRPSVIPLPNAQRLWLKTKHKNVLPAAFYSQSLCLLSYAIWGSKIILLVSPPPELQCWSWWNPRVQVAISLLACTSGCKTSKYNDPLLTTITWQVSPFKPCIRPLYQTNDKNASSRHVIHKRFLYTLCLEVANSWFSTEGTSQDASGFSRVYQVIASRTQFWECAC